MALYNLIFQGQIINGASLNEVKANVARLFKADTAKTAALFSGKSIIIKKNLDTESAKKYLAVLKKAGAVVKAVKVENEFGNDNTASPSPSGGLSSGLASLVNYNNTTETPPQKDAPVQQSSHPQQKAPVTANLQLAPENSDFPDQKKTAESIDIPDISHLSMSEAHTGSLAEFARTIEAVELPNIDNLTMSDANTGSLEEFALTAEPVVLPDISALGVAEQDNTPLSAESPRPGAVEIPDVSELTMSEAQQGSLEGLERKPEPVEIPDIKHLSTEQPEEKKEKSGKAVFQIN